MRDLPRRNSSFRWPAKVGQSRSTAGDSIHWTDGRAPLSIALPPRSPDCRCAPHKAEHLRARHFRLFDLNPRVRPLARYPAGHKIASGLRRPLVVGWMHWLARPMFGRRFTHIRSTARPLAALFARRGCTLSIFVGSTDAPMRFRQCAFAKAHSTTYQS
jgi:hypothetical protein